MVRMAGRTAGGLLVVWLLGACPEGRTPPGCPDPKSCNAGAVCSEKVCEGKAWYCRQQADGKYSWAAERCPTTDGPLWPDLGAVDGLPDRPPPSDARREAVRPPDGKRPPDTKVPPDTKPPPPPDKSCACAPGSYKACGPCNLGREYCRSDCSGYDGNCTGLPSDVCNSGQTRGCGNCNKGSQTCNNCSWGSCNNQPCSPGSKVGCPNGCGERTCDGSCNFGECSMKDQYVGPSGSLCWSDNHCGPGNGRCVECWLKCDGNGNTYKDGWCAGSCTSCPPPANPNC